MNRYRNVFVMMRYVEDSTYSEIEKTIKETLRKYNLRGILAKDVFFYPQLWNHISFCMDNSSYGIAVFERMTLPDYNPNVELEMGYILALKHPCLILKEKSFPPLNTNVISHIYKKFDSHAAKETISRAIEEWLHTLGHKLFRAAVTITAKTPIEANKKRTRQILKALNGIQVSQESKKENIIRQAASLSSLAITDNERDEGDSNGSYQKLLIKERDTITGLLDQGIKIRLIICPEAQIERVELRLVKKPFAERNILPRYDRLITIIHQYLDERNFQIVHTLRLPHDNLIIINDEVIFIGRKRRRERGFPYTTEIYDPAVLKDEISEFDITFCDNASALLHSKDACAERHYSSRRLKLRVIEKLQDSQLRLKRLIEKYYK